MSFSNFNMNGIQDIFFPQNETMENIPVQTKSNEFNFAQVWGEIGGEYNHNKSEFIEACKLIVSNNTLAAAIVMNEQASCSNNQMDQNPLAAFIGDITPAATAVAGPAGESPMMATPFLDTCVSTPFTPASVFTPSLNQYQNSPYYSPYYGLNMGTTVELNQDDVQVCNYLTTDMSSWQTPAHITADLFANTPAITSTDLTPPLLNSYDQFNGDPTQLLLDSTSISPIATNIASVDDSSDPLFPPLRSEEPLVDTMITHHDIQQQNNVFNADDFEASNFLEDCFDDCLYNMNQTTSNKTEVIQPIQPMQHMKPMITEPTAACKASTTTRNKRKIQDTNTEKKNKRIKTSNANNDKDRKFECEVCHVTFNRRYNLGTHIKIHNSDRVKDFGCHLCVKAFDRKHDLTRHVATVHNGERAYACDVCTSAFSRKDALVRHQIQKH